MRPDDAMTLIKARIRSRALRVPDTRSAASGAPPWTAVLRRGLAALRASLTRPRWPPDVPNHLRADLGLPPADEVPGWFRHPIDPNEPDPLRPRRRR